MASDREIRRIREARERRAAASGPGIFGGTIARHTPQFIRRGYEAGIVDELKEFYARRPRPWRPASRAPKRLTHKERLKRRPRA